MDISYIQAYVQNLEDRKRQRRTDCDRDGGHGKRSRSFDIRGQGSRASDSQYRPESGQMRPSLPRYAQCGKLHAGQCRLGSDGSYACGQLGHRVSECPMRIGTGMVEPTGSVAGSSSIVRASGKVFQPPAGRGRERNGASSSSGPQLRVYALAGSTLSYVTP
ncbi:uncharacterized protein LOC132613000 [Lycium barbarum]|uniref:uncharacterized protein LOC132613000 n=1 Tax=Lycium barbarum TaxID=112863 RepID=UPI00293E91FF|nr:uncharacterized protein LOC132613000 [Lycium barbarum]